VYDTEEINPKQGKSQFTSEGYGIPKIAIQIVVFDMSEHACYGSTPAIGEGQKELNSTERRK
jgi:hypothetical protein